MVRTPQRPALSTCIIILEWNTYIFFKKKEYRFLSCTSGPGRVNYL
jgi:hypothetical protein